MKWTNLVKKRHESILIGGTLFGILLGVMAGVFIYLLGINYCWETKLWLAITGGLLVAVVSVIGNYHYTANKLMMVEAIEMLREIKEKLNK